MPISSYKLVDTDIDGTLVPYRIGRKSLAEIDAFIPDSAKAAIQKLHRAWVAVAGIKDFLLLAVTWHHAGHVERRRKKLL